MFELEDERTYCVEEAKKFLHLSTAQTCRLFKQNKIPKEKNKYIATGQKIREIKDRLNQTAKQWMLSDY